MFERYTEQARRVIFFGRYEASSLGQIEIEPEHLLLGVMRENQELFAGNHVDASQLHDELTAKLMQHPPAGPVVTSVDLPLSIASKRVLAKAAALAEAKQDRHIAPRHFLLGILAEGTAAANEFLAGIGVTEASVLANKAVPGLRKTFLGTGSGNLRTQGMLPLSSEALRVLAAAVDEAERAGRTSVDAGNLLLGLLTEPSASRLILEEAGIDLRRARQRLGRNEAQ